MAFPSSLDSLVSAVPNPADPLTVGAHTTVHRNVAIAVEALEAKVGIDGSADTDSIDYRLARLEAAVTPPITTKTSDFTAAAANAVYLCNAAGGAITATLPTAASSSGVEIVFKKIDTSDNFVTIDGDGSEPIDDSSTKILPVQNNTLRVLSNGVQWYVV